MPDYAVGTTLDTKFSTSVNGTPTALSGGTVSAYPTNSTTQTTTGVTLTADFDGVTGLNHVRVVATSGNGYSAGDYQLVITAGTVGGVSVVGRVVGEFSLDMAATAIRGAVGLASANLDTQLDALPTNAELATALGTADDAVLAAIAALNNLSSAGAQAAAAAALSAYGAALTSDIPTTAQIADKVLGRNLAGSSDGGRTVKDALRALRNKVNIDASTITVYQEDDTTTAWSGTATRADLDALQTVDPS